MPTPTLLEYALLADRAYADLRNRANNLPVLPSGWAGVADLVIPGIPAFTELEGHYGGPTMASGFSAAVYKKGIEVVISFEGTNPAPLSPDGRRDWLANAAAFFGVTVPQQLIEAAKLYLAVKRSQPEGTPITFTGHSLGGGLATLMSVFFDHPATTFATAPFEGSAKLAVISDLRSALIAFGATSTELSKLTQLLNDLSLDPIYQTDILGRRESSIVSQSINGEVLSLLRAHVTTLMSVNGVIDMGRTNLGAIDKHSMLLHAAAVVSREFREASKLLANLLPLVMDTQLYARNVATGPEIGVVARFS
jgi:trimeric autotransporter adhesin